MNSLLIKKTILNASIKLDSYKTDSIVLIFGIYSSGNIYICIVVLLVWLPDRDRDAVSLISVTLVPLRLHSPKETSFDYFQWICTLHIVSLELLRPFFFYFRVYINLLAFHFIVFVTVYFYHVLYRFRLWDSVLFRPSRLAFQAPHQTFIGRASRAPTYNYTAAVCSSSLSTRNA
jgi:hypothetical protein